MSRPAHIGAALVVLLVTLLSGSAGAGAPGSSGATIPADRLARERGLTVARIEGPAENFSRQCQGCHGHHGVSVAEVPTLRGRVGYFLHTVEGRAYLPRVPGVAFAHLDDEALAGVLNWMLKIYSAGELPEDFSPYTAEEVGRLRQDPLDEVSAERAAIVEGLVAAGVVENADALAFGTSRRY